MRSSVQDLFQLGMVAQDAGTTTGPARSGRKAHKHDGESAVGSVDFETAMALAATLAATPSPAFNQSPPLQLRHGQPSTTDVDASASAPAGISGDASAFAFSSHSRLSREVGTNSLPLLESASDGQQTGERGVAFADASTASDTAAIRNLLARLANPGEQSGGSDVSATTPAIDAGGLVPIDRPAPPQTPMAPEAVDEVGAGSLADTTEDGGSGIQLDYRPVRRLIPVVTENWTPESGVEALDQPQVADGENLTPPVDVTQTGDVAATELPLEFDQVAPQPAPFPLEQTDRLIADEPILPPPVAPRDFPEQTVGTRPFWTRRQQPVDASDAPAATPRFGNQSVNGPELRVVSRNDNPAPGQDVEQPELRLIEFTQRSLATEPDDDLVALIADVWEQSIAEGEVDLPAATPRLTALPTVIANTLAPRERDQLARVSASDDTAPADALDAPEPMPFKIKAVSAGSELGGQFDGMTEQHDGGTDATFSAERGSAPQVSRAAGEPSATPVALFDDFLSTRSIERAQPGPDAPVAVRQAALEIATEVSRLQRNGGSEISFSLRLHPEHLGEVRVEIQRVDNVWSLSITAANDEAREALAAEIGRLEHRFREHDLKLDGISVATQPRDESISAPAQAERASSSGLGDNARQGLPGEQNRDQSGWRNPSPATILGFDSRDEAETAQELTRRHDPTSVSGVDIKA